MLNKKIICLVALVVLFSSVTVLAADDTLLDSEVKGIEDLKEKANSGVKTLMWFFRLFGIAMLATAFAKMYWSPDEGKKAVVFAIIGTIGIVLAPDLANGINSYFG